MQSLLKFKQVVSVAGRRNRRKDKLFTPKFPAQFAVRAISQGKRLGTQWNKHGCFDALFFKRLALLLLTYASGFGAL